jgi:ribulose bisphosphate carboxylase small subunit
MSAPYDPDSAAATLFHPLADPDRREQDPLRALQAAHDLRILLSLGELAAVRHARQAGPRHRSWSEIGEALAITKQAAQQRFGVLVDQADDVE